MYDFAEINTCTGVYVPVGPPRTHIKSRLRERKEISIERPSTMHTRTQRHTY